MQTFDAISQRISTRAYQSKSIDRALLEKLVDAGKRAPTARGVEPWEFIVVTNQGCLQKLSELVSPNGSFVKNAASCIVIYCKDTKYYLEDGCAATENILLMAADLELGACWIAGDKKPYTTRVAELFGVPDNFKLISLISLGWPEQKSAQSRNRPLKEVLHWEKF